MVAANESPITGRGNVAEWLLLVAAAAIGESIGESRHRGRSRNRVLERWTPEVSSCARSEVGIGSRERALLTSDAQFERKVRWWMTSESLKVNQPKRSGRVVSFTFTA